MNISDLVMVKPLKWTRSKYEAKTYDASARGLFIAYDGYLWAVYDNYAWVTSARTLRLAKEACQTHFEKWVYKQLKERR